ncbi:phosphate acyltransferase PlsX [bacterium]|nr:phosphate acyltransferase PlsX [bacterium]
MKIIVDAMGGDEAPKKIVDGAVEAAREFLSQGHQVILTGHREKIMEEIHRCEGNDLVGKSIDIVHTDEVIGMCESPTTALREKMHSSIHIGIEMVKRGEGDAFVSMGNTGAVMACGLMGLGRIEGVQRPTIGAFFPTIKGKSLVLDVGANVDSKPVHLLQFGVMGSIYMHAMMNIPTPKVGLLSIGEEDSKGDNLTIQANQLFREKQLFEFAGNVEGRDILMGSSDVVVCDGFVGNVVLKMTESFVKVLQQKIGGFAQQAGAEAGKTFKEFFTKSMSDWDYQSHGGVPLLGVNGVVIIGHGSSSGKALYRAIHVAKEMVEKKINEVIREKIKLS